MALYMFQSMANTRLKKSTGRVTSLLASILLQFTDDHQFV